MVDDQIIIAGLWVAVVLCYLYGDVFSIISGDFTPGEVEGKPLTQIMVLVMALIMVIPIIMVPVSLILDYSINRWMNIIVATVFIGFNLLSIRGYPIYQRFLLIISMGFNLLTVFYAWNWI